MSIAFILVLQRVLKGLIATPSEHDRSEREREREREKKRERERERARERKKKTLENIYIKTTKKMKGADKARCLC